jgi:hypothetical protein
MFWLGDTVLMADTPIPDTFQESIPNTDTRNDVTIDLQSMLSNLFLSIYIIITQFLSMYSTCGLLVSHVSDTSVSSRSTAKSIGQYRKQALNVLGVSDKTTVLHKLFDKCVALFRQKNKC